MPSPCDIHDKRLLYLMTVSYGPARELRKQTPVDGEPHRLRQGACAVDHKFPCHSYHSGVVFIKLGARRCLTYTLASTLPHRDAYSQVSLWNQRRIVDDCLGIIDARFDTGQPAAGTAFASSFSKTVAPPFSHEVRSL